LITTIRLRAQRRARLLIALVWLSAAGGATADVSDPPFKPVDSSAIVPETNVPDGRPKEPDVPFLPTPDRVVDTMLKAAKITRNDVIYDLGCGDARILIAAAKRYGARGVGYEVLPWLVERARANAKKAGVEHLVHIVLKDMFEADLSPATVVMLFVGPKLDEQLIPQLRRLRPGARIVSHNSIIKGTREEKAWMLKLPSEDPNDPPRALERHDVYLWHAPLRISARNIGPKDPDVAFYPTPPDIIDSMLNAAAVTKNDLVYDLGSGDGRMLIRAARKYGARGVGIDVDPRLVERARANARIAKVDHLVRFELKDLFDVDLSPATVVTLYLSPEVNARLVPQLRKLRPGARIVSHEFEMAHVKADREWSQMSQGLDLDNPKSRREHFMYLWRAPLRVAP
jgi:predicted RNA methylase